MSTEARVKLKLTKKNKFKLSTSKNSVRTKDAEKSMDKPFPSAARTFPRGNGSRGNFRKNVRTKRIQSGEERVGRDFDEREKLRADYNGRKKRVYAREETGQNRKSYNGTTTSKKVKEEVVAKIRVRSRWVSSKSDNANSEAKNSSTKVKAKEENVNLPNAKQRTKAKEACKKKSVMTDGNGTGLMKKQREQKSDFIKDKNQNVAFPSSSTKKKSRVKAGLDDDVEMTNDQPKKKKRVIRIDPHDISNKRLDDGIVTSGTTKDKKKESEEKLEMSKNARFRAIQPSPSILSFVENNLLGRRRSIEIKRAGYNIDLSAPLDNIPFSTSSERERVEENIFRNKLDFFAAAKVSSSFPPPSLPEIAFAGRSNVGKSSLLNALTRQWGVVRTSDKPGLTQSINFFNLGSKLCLVDLPGYGFAYAKEEVKEAWEELVKEYVSTRVGLKRVCLLIDTKWGMKPRDHELIELMESYQTKYQIVLTKTDVVFPIDVARRAMQIEESLKENKSVVQPTMMVSSKSGAGIRCLRTVLTKIARFAKL